jgi:hypothetical protein
MNEPQYIDLAQVPLLMVSYSDSKELQQYFSQISFSEPAGLSGGITAAEQAGNFLNRQQPPLAKQPQWMVLFFNRRTRKRDPYHSCQIAQRRLARNAVSQRIMKQKRITVFEKYHALNLWNTVKLPYKLLLIDDIWNLVKAKPASLSIQLFRIILNGPAVGVSYHYRQQYLLQELAATSD